MLAAARTNGTALCTGCGSSYLVGQRRARYDGLCPICRIRASWQASRPRCV